MERKVEGVLREWFGIGDQAVIKSVTVNYEIVHTKALMGEDMGKKVEADPSGEKPTSIADLAEKLKARGNPVSAKRNFEPKKEKPEKKHIGRKLTFDFDVRISKVDWVKDRLSKLTWQKKLNEEELGCYENLCKGVKVEDMSVSHKDKIIALYKRVGRRLVGGDDE